MCRFQSAAGSSACRSGFEAKPHNEKVHHFGGQHSLFQKVAIALSERLAGQDRRLRKENVYQSACITTPENSGVLHLASAPAAIQSGAEPAQLSVNPLSRLPAEVQLFLRAAIGLHLLKAGLLEAR